MEIRQEPDGTPVAWQHVKAGELIALYPPDGMARVIAVKCDSCLLVDLRTGEIRNVGELGPGYPVERIRGHVQIGRSAGS